LETVVWPASRSLPGKSNTGQEIKNIFDLAIERNVETIGFVTVGVHTSRTWTYIGKCQSREEKYADLSVKLFDGEEILLKADYNKYASRIESLRKSESMKRNWPREATGMFKIIIDAYGDAKPLVVPTTA